MVKLGWVKNKTFILLIIFALPLIFLFTSFAWNDHLLIAMMLCSSYFWLNFLSEVWKGNKGKTADIFLGALFLGLAALCKYNAVFLALGIVSMILFNKRLHIVLKDIRIYISVIFCAIVVSPIFIWNAQNSYGSFEFTLAERTIQPFLQGRFFKGNIAGFLLGTLVLLTPVVMFYSFKLSAQKNKNVFSFEAVYVSMAKNVFWWSTGIFLFLSLFSNVLYYWNIPAYLLLLPLIIKYMIEKVPKLAKATLIFSLVVNILIVIHFGLIPLTVFIGQNDADGAYHYGWQKLKKTITQSKVYSNEIPIVASSYRIASGISYALNRPDVMSYSKRFDQFDYWARKKSYHQPKAIVIADDNSPIDEELSNLFQKIEIKDTIIVDKFGYFIKNYYLYEGTF